MKVGDVLVAVDGQAVTDSATMLNLIAALTPGSQATLRVMRETKEIDLKVTVGKRPKQPRKAE
jgi:serine protease DegQ